MKFIDHFELLHYCYLGTGAFYPSVDPIIPMTDGYHGSACLGNILGCVAATQLTETHDWSIRPGTGLVADQHLVIVVFCSSGSRSSQLSVHHIRLLHASIGSLHSRSRSARINAVAFP